MFDLATEQNKPSTSISKKKKKLKKSREQNKQRFFYHLYIYTKMFDLATE